jgi:lysophospholipase L1-like esterase
MKKLFVFLFVAFTLPAITKAQVTNQRLFDTANFMPEHYAQRMALFATQKLPKNPIVFLGNSITEMGNWQKLLNDFNVVNRGIGGDNTYGVLHRLPEIIGMQPAKVFLLIGINDIGKDIPGTVIAHNIATIVKQLKEGSPDTKIYVESIMPVNPDVPNFPQHYDKQGYILTANKLSKAAMQPLQVPFINIHDLFPDAQGRLNAKYTADGLHLTQTGGGYEKWIAFLKKGGYL